MNFDAKRCAVGPSRNAACPIRPHCVVPYTSPLCNIHVTVPETKKKPIFYDRNRNVLSNYTPINARNVTCYKIALAALLCKKSLGVACDSLQETLRACARFVRYIMQLNRSCRGQIEAVGERWAAGFVPMRFAQLHAQTCLGSCQVSGPMRHCRIRFGL